MKLIALTAALLLAPAVADAQISRTYGSPTAAIAQTVKVPAGYETLYLSGALPDPVTPARDGKPAEWGGTEVQAASVFAKIEATLKANGYSSGDVVSMTIYMLGDPANGGRMDFAGMMRSYGKFYGTAAQPNRPSRSTVQVAALAGAGALLEVEVTAAKKP